MPEAIEEDILASLDGTIELNRAARTLLSWPFLSILASQRPRHQPSTQIRRAGPCQRLPNYPRRSISLNVLPVNIHDRFHQQRVMFDLYEAIELHQAALKQISFRLRITWDYVVSRIRMLPAFSVPSTVLRPPESGRRWSSHHYRYNGYSCDELVTLHTLEPVHVVLDVSQMEASKWSSLHSSCRLI
ncbi:uncharacterized protein EDB93DRAFT_1248242 [Suillus bovinus]|uniref:uncharacterized protein n=1 Tax=Suillus bovinus TaxID=48563 RepID=UPI001B8856DD|nr:uncharacterized protein EDB93DRAFT_1248242 [Suillus bovinus]KAG2154443.1 hypothetical protein EDB93DRAFT_1248242 [Suillus bovinus]